MCPQIFAIRMIYSTICNRYVGLYGKTLRIWTLQHYKSGALTHSEGVDHGA